MLRELYATRTARENKAERWEIPGEKETAREKETTVLQQP